MKKFILLTLMLLLLSWSINAQTAITPAGDGSQSNPYQIATLENLYWITVNSSVWDKYFIQTADIDASATLSWSGSGWVPIGNTYEEFFTGNYNGNGKTISGLYLRNYSYDGLGLFGVAIGATFQNLGIINITFDGIEGSAGGLVGYSERVTINDCYSSGLIKAYFTGNLTGGGLVGSFLENSIMLNCYSSCQVIGGNVVGGLVGYNGLSTISKCHYFNGDVQGYSIEGTITGGLIGGNQGIITECYSESTKVIGFDYTGGLVGINLPDASISNSYSRCLCQNNSVFEAHGGGLVGVNMEGATITNCYSPGKLQSNMGGLVGINNGTIGNSFWNTDVAESGAVWSSGGIGKTTAELKTQSTFIDAGWDFTNIWGINPANNDGYPYFMPESSCSNGTIALTSGSENQTICAGTAITDIVYTIGGGATGASVSPALPAGLSGVYDAVFKKYTISGTPTVAGVFNYTVTTTGTASPCNNATANGTITVTAPPSAPGEITGPATVCAGGIENVYSVEAVSGATSYNWTVPEGAEITSGSGTNSITVNFGSTSGTVSVNASNSCGISLPGTLEVAVNTELTPSVTITSSDSDNKICNGQLDPVFTAHPANTNEGTVSYQWYQNETTSSAWNAATWTGTDLVSGDVVRCEITVTKGTCSVKAVSNSILNEVYDQFDPSVIIESNVSGTFCYGTEVIFTATPNNAGGGTVAYQWKINNVPAGNNQNTFSFTELDNGDKISCDITVTDAACFSFKTASSNEITISVYASPEAGTIVGQSSICAGSTKAFSVTGNDRQGTWFSDNVSVATVSETGEVTAVGAGSVIIGYYVSTTEPCEDFDVATFNVTVNPLSVVDITGSSSIYAGETTTLTPTSGGTWTSSNEAVATVTDEGMVTGVSGGTVTFAFTNATTGCSASTAEITVTGCISPVATAPAVGDGTSGNPYQIASLENLYWISASDDVVASPSQEVRFGAHYIQTANIDASATVAWCDGGWNPIGYVDDDWYVCSFRGIYNGQGHTISGLTIDNTSQKAYGLFGRMYDATIQNLGITDVEFNTEYGSSGALAGWAEKSKINNCYSSGNIIANEAGGLVAGLSSNSEMKDCYSSCNVSGMLYAGGLIGHNNNSLVSDCYASAVIVTGLKSYTNTGGLVGYNNYYGSISRCYSTGLVKGIDGMGGLVGINHYNASISNCYSRTNLEFNSAYASTSGGLAGGNLNNSMISNCYSTGFVGSEISGLVGYQTTGQIINSFWDMYTSGSEWNITDVGATGKTTAEMKTQSTFAGWDFTTIWGINSANNDGYPYFVPESSCSNGTIALASESGTENQTICTGASITDIVYTIGGGATGAEVSGLPEGVTGNYENSTFTISGTPTVAGTYPYTVTTTGTASPCTNATATGTVTVSALPDAGTIKGSDEICLGETSLLKVDGDEGGVWLSNNEEIVHVNEIGTLSALKPGTTIITYTVNGSGACAGQSDVAEFEITVKPFPEAGDIQGQNEICIGNSTVLTSDGDANGTWSSDNENVATVSQAGEVEGWQAGSATITYTVYGTGGCSGEEDYATFEISVSSPPDVTFAATPSNTPICESGDAEFYLTGTPNAVVAYTISDNDGAADKTVTLNSSGEATVVVSGAFKSQTVTLKSVQDPATECTQSLSANAVVEVKPVPDASFASPASNTPVCSGSNAEFNLIGTPGATVTYSFDEGTTTSSATLDAISGLATVTITGVTQNQTMILVGVDDGNCTKTLGTFAIVDVNPLPVVAITGNTTVYIGGTTNLSPTTGGSWKSNNEDVATVTDKGLVTGIAEGTASFTFTDATTGCSATTEEITVTGTPPVFTACPGNQTANTSTGLCNAVVTYEAAATGSPEAVLTYAFSGATKGNGSGTGSGSAFNRGETNVTITASNGILPNATCSFKVTVTDNEAPAITCAQEITQTADAGICSAVVNVVPPVVTDNCDNNVLPVSNTELIKNGNFNAGDSYWENCGNTAEALTEEYYIVPLPPKSSNYVAEVDKEVSLCQNISGFVVGNKYVLTFKATRRQNTSTPNPVSANVIIDGDALSKVVTRTNTIFDLTPESFEFTATKETHRLTFTPSANNTSTLGFIVDDVSVRSITYPVGTTTLVWTATDVHGNTASCEQDITVTDDEVPVITDGADITQTADEGMCSAVVEVVPATATDNCGIQGSVAGTRSDAPLTLTDPFPVGTTTITWTVSDVNGNPAAPVTQLVTVTDNEAPAITCAQEITQTADAGMCSAVVNVVPPVVTDNCDNNVLPVSSTELIENGNFNAGVSNWKDCGNKAEVEAEEFYIVPLPPKSSNYVAEVDKEVSLCQNISGFVVGHKYVLTFKATRRQNTSTPNPVSANVIIDGDALSKVVTRTNTIFDLTPESFEFTATKETHRLTFTPSANNTSTLGFIVDDVSVRSITYPVGTTTLVWTATDVYGNTNSCEQKITVTDDEAPTFTAPAGYDLECVGELPVAAETIAEFLALDEVVAAADNCTATADLKVTHSDAVTAEGNCAGVIARTYTITDGCNNSVDVYQVFTVTDNTNPTAICKDIEVTLGQDGTVLIDENAVNNGSSDNCTSLSSLEFDTDVTSFDCTKIGVNQVEMTVTDECGNFSTCKAVVKVLPYTAATEVSVLPDPQQYSDEATFTATVSPASVKSGCVAATHVTFWVGTQQMGPAVALTNGAVSIDYPLTELPSWPSNGQMAPGLHEVKAVFSGTDPAFVVPEAATTLAINQENVIIDYIGTEIVGEANQDVNTTPVTLRATITDNYMNDDDRGDIRNARVRFEIDGSPISGWLVPALVYPAEITQGIVSYVWDAPVPSSGYATYDITVKVGDNGYYIGSLDDVPVTVYRTSLREFISGGGHIIPVDSKGEYASDPGRKVNFGFNVKWNKTMKNLQGNFNLILRRGSEIYQIKSNALSGLGVDGSNPCSHKAVLAAKANLNRVTGGVTENIMGNLSLQVTLTDNGEPGVVDRIGVTLYNGSTLLYSSSWPVSSTEELTLVGGNILVNDGIICNATDKSYTVLTSSKNPSYMTDEVKFIASVYGVNDTPEGSVQFMVDGVPVGNPVLLDKGVAPFTTSDLTEGSHEISAYYTSTNGYKNSSGSITQLVKASSLVIISSMNPSVEGDIVSFTAKVSGGSGHGTGTVTFMDGNALLAENVEMTDGSAWFETDDLSLGSHTITALYSGDGNYNAGMVSLKQMITGSTISLASSKNPSVIGESVTFTATVTGSSAVGTSVTFKNSDIELGTGTVDASGNAVLSISSLFVGSHTISAVHESGKTAILTQVVIQPQVVLISSKNPSVEGEEITFTATITGTSGGTVRFISDTGEKSETVVNGIAIWKISLNEGSHLIEAEYYIDDVLISKSSLTQYVNAENITVELVSSKPLSVVYGTNITYTATVKGSVDAPSGTITFKDGTTVLKNVLVSGGKASFSTNKLAVGYHPVTATYNLTGTVSNTIQQTITAKTKSAEIGSEIEPEVELADLKVYPNPFSERLRFEFVSPEPVDARIDLYDMTGRLVKTIFEQPIDGDTRYEAEFRPADIVSDVYIYRVILGEAVYNGKAIFKMK